MKRLLLSALILLCCISQSAAWMNVTTVGGGVPAAAPAACATCSVNFTDGFANLTAFVEDYNTWTSGSDTYPEGGWTVSFLRHGTATNAECQWAKVQLVNIVGTTGTDYGGGLALRQTGATGYRYVVFYLPNTTQANIQWRIYSADTLSSTVATQNITALSNNDYIGARVRGTGNDTVMDVWINPSGDPDCPANWGDPDITFSDNPANAADSGTYTGIFGYYGSSGGITWDNFSGGDE